VPEISARLFRGLAWSVLLGVTACVLPSARWDVPDGAKERFAEARKACHQLTSPDAERFEDCMRRRGFEHESLWQRSWRGLTGR
jgi:hypothetical protein